MGGRGRVEIHCDGRKLPYSPLDQHPHVDPGEEVLENKRVQAFLDRFAVEQAERRRKQNTKSNDRKREREFAAAKGRGSERHVLGAALLTHEDAPHP